jgi:MFS family permease
VRELQADDDLQSSAAVSSSSGPDGARERPVWTLYTPRQRHLFLGMLFLVTTSNYFDFYIVSVVLYPIKLEFHVSDTMLGVLSGFSFALLYAIAAVPIAHWADRGNRRTITTLTLAGWSIMTMLCAAATSFGQLVFARMGVAVTEPGAAPPAQSLIADYFPPHRRSLAAAILAQGGSAAGFCIAIGLGGYVAATHGWRFAFLSAGLPGLILAIIVRLTLAEPRTRTGFPSESPDTESVRQGLVRLRAKRSYLWILGAVTTFTLFGYGASVFLPSFMVRTLHADFERISTIWGLSTAAAMLVGAFVGGWMADQLGERDVRWYAWLPALGSALGVPLYWATLSAQSVWTFIVIDFPAELILAVATSVSFASIHVICGTPRRSLAFSIVYFLITFIGCGFGPLLAGMLSDALDAVYGTESLRQALLIMVLFLLPAAGFYWFASRAIARDREA